MFFVIVLMVLFGRHLLLMFVAIGAVNWLDMARVVRGQTLNLRRREFVAAAQLAGLTDAQIITRHVVPNLLGLVIVYEAVTLPQVILIESFLSLLVLGVHVPANRAGAPVNDAAHDIESPPYQVVVPA